MHGVESADVDFDKEEPRGLRRDRIATAFVALKLQAGQTLDEDRAAFFQRTVAAALIMAPHDVTVVDKVNHVVFGGRGSDAPADDLYRDLKRKYQADYEENVRKSLAYVPGITVNADVELDRELRREERRIEFDANQPANLATPSAAHRGESMDLSNNTSEVHRRAQPDQDRNRGADTQAGLDRSRRAEQLFRKHLATAATCRR